jgi:hypothetical protein
MFKPRLRPEAITKVRNYTGFSPTELLIVIAIMVCWPANAGRLFSIWQNEAMKQR